ncbi:MAG: hypothetical protein J3Q66DRAFT_404794 [Benniella sp.]|nr:MAG: hypothetical protein J3Q66DRAFT_404794 [Benniella sp.]
MERLMGSRKTANDMIADNLGEFYHWLFIGSRDAIRLKIKNTSYGKSTTTMLARTREDPERYGDDAIKSLVQRFSEYFKNRKLAKDKKFSVQRETTKDPSGRGHSDRQSMKDALGWDYRNSVTIGADPGEVVTAQFCAIFPTFQDKVSVNVGVQTQALGYQVALGDEFYTSTMCPGSNYPQGDYLHWSPDLYSNSRPPPDGIRTLVKRVEKVLVRTNGDQ